MVCCFVKNVHENQVKHIKTSSLGVGVMGIAGNKGGVSIRLQFYDSTLCFICTHLAAHRENIAGRNSDFANVYGKTKFHIGREAIRDLARAGSLAHWENETSKVSVGDHDMVFWLGDLNYRIDESITTQQVLENSEQGVLGELIANDQLNIERAAGRVFQGFNEGRLSFAPTYKYQPGTDVYEQRPDKKLRAPAWCDRILWLSEEPDHVQQLSYDRSETPNISDHKPVYSTMRVVIKDVIQRKLDVVYAGLSASNPQMMLSARGALLDPAAKPDPPGIAARNLNFGLPGHFDYMDDSSSSSSSEEDMETPDDGLYFYEGDSSNEPDEIESHYNEEWDDTVSPLPGRSHYPGYQDIEQGNLSQLSYSVGGKDQGESSDRDSLHVQRLGQTRRDQQNIYGNEGQSLNGPSYVIQLGNGLEAQPLNDSYKDGYSYASGTTVVRHEKKKTVPWFLIIPITLGCFVIMLAVVLLVILIVLPQSEIEGVY
jgi:hypothetical protein